jgi:hypothetical protein
VVDSIELRDPATATGPGTSLDTIVIITQPELVEAEVVQVEPATAEDAQAILANLPDVGISLDPNATGAFTTDEVIARVPQSIRDATEALLIDNNHLFSVSVSHINDTCDTTSIPLMRVKYTLHAFSSRADATNVIADAYLVDFSTNGNDYTSVEGEILANPIYYVDSNACSTTAMRVITFWQRGRFVALAEAILPLTEVANAEAWLNQVVGTQVYEYLLTDLLVPEIRND